VSPFPLPACPLLYDRSLRSIPLYTLYGHLLEEYHRDGRGHALVTQLYEQKRTQERDKGPPPTDPPPPLAAGPGTGTSSTPGKMCGKGVDLQLVSQMMEVERRRGNHEQALAVLQETIDSVQRQKPRSPLLLPPLLTLHAYW
jgi:hypothetical protein